MMLQGSLARVARLALLAASLPVVGGCSGGATGSRDGHLRLAMVTDVGGLGDKSFNDSAYRGLTAARRRLGAEIEVLQSKSAADYQPNLTALADEGFDEIFAIGFLMSKDVALVARDNPQRQFALVDAVVAAPNVTSIMFREQDGSFLAGALAALVSRTKTIGFLGGMDVPLLRKFEAGFTAGAREVDPKIDVIVKYVGSFEDVPAGKELASVLFDQRADVVYVAAGKSGLGAIDETRNRPNVYAIGVDSDQDSLAPGKVLTSVLKHVDIAVFRLAQEARARTVHNGTLEFGLRDGGVGLTDFRYSQRTVSPAIRARLETLRRAIVDGKIVPPKTREELVRFRPVSV